MGFQGIGIWEILIILIVVLIVLGPRRLPEIARTLGKAVRAMKKASTDFTATITREVEEVKNEPPSQPKETKTEEAPSAINKASTPGRDDQSTKPEGHQQRNE